MVENAVCGMYFSVLNIPLKMHQWSPVLHFQKQKDSSKQKLKLIVSQCDQFWWFFCLLESWLQNWKFIAAVFQMRKSLAVCFMVDINHLYRYDSFINLMTCTAFEYYVRCELVTWMLECEWRARKLRFCWMSDGSNIDHMSCLV